MKIEQRQSLLAATDPSPVRITNPGGRSSFLFVGDHAGNAIPARLGALGLGADDLNRHIALDIGISELGALLASTLDATFIEQRYSRLVVDCNRAKTAVDVIAAVSDGTCIPGNTDLTEDDRDCRFGEIHAPYHEAIAKALVRRDAAGLSTVFVALHSFTPRLDGMERPWEVGVLYDGGDTGFATAMLDRLRARGGSDIGDNQPYRMDGTDYTVPLHCYPLGRPYVELEIRQDMLSTASRRARSASRLAEALLAALGASDLQLSKS